MAALIVIAMVVVLGPLAVAQARLFGRVGHE